MGNKIVKVVARITAQPDKLEEMTSLLVGLVKPTREENGCISYQLLHNIADPGDFTFVEEWVDDSAIDAHFTRAYVQDALSRAGPLLAKEPDIRRYSIIE